MCINVPSISVVIPTFNSERTLSMCLDSITEQDYPKSKIEIIIVDGGSTDRTLKIVKKYDILNVYYNPLRTGESGKSLGVKHSNNDLVALIDSDNILPQKDWMKIMVKPFEKPTVVGVEPIRYTYRLNDPLISRYCALIGMNDVLCLYFGNYDRYSYLTNTWTGLDIPTINKPEYLLVELNDRNIPTMGANGFIIRKICFDQIKFSPYLFDVDVIYQLIKHNYNHFAKIKIGIIHLYAFTLNSYMKKTFRRIKEHSYYSSLNLRLYPWSHFRRKHLAKFILDTLLIFPLVKDSLAAYSKIPDKALFFHPIACWLTLLIYGTFSIFGELLGVGKK